MSEQPDEYPLIWQEEFDLSALSYEEFLKFFFDRTVVVDHKQQYDLFRAGIDGFIASEPAKVLAHLQAMCMDLPGLSKIYSAEQLDQGLWQVFGANIDCQRWLFDTDVDLGTRIDCIESMYLPFSDLVAQSIFDRFHSFYFMWWDMILHSIALYHNDPTQTEDGKQVLDAIYRTLVRILANDNWNCEFSALHGLGHLRHPKVRETVENYLEVQGSRLSDEDRKWVEQCREGRIM